MQDPSPLAVSFHHTSSSTGSRLPSPSRIRQKKAAKGLKKNPNICTHRTHNFHQSGKGVNFIPNFHQSGTGANLTTDRSPSVPPCGTGAEGRPDQAHFRQFGSAGRRGALCESSSCVEHPAPSTPARGGEAANRSKTGRRCPGQGISG